MTVSPFTRTFLLIFSGPLIWAVHFLAIYVFVALACARQFADVVWLGAGVAQWAVGMLTLAGVGSVAAVIVLYDRRHDQPGRDAADFVRWTTFTLGALSIGAMVWEAVPAYLVPVCG